MKRQILKVWPDFQAVVVPEIHTGSGANQGSYHLHAAIKGFRNITMLRLFLHRALGASGIVRGSESPGNVDIHANSQRHSWKRTSLARYLTKYMSKGIESQDAHRKRFTTCGKIAEPKQVRFYSSCGDDALLRIQREIETYAGVDCRTVWKIPDPIEECWYLATY